jgi:hypothetical protein
MRHITAEHLHKQRSLFSFMYYELSEKKTMLSLASALSGRNTVVYSNLRRLLLSFNDINGKRLNALFSEKNLCAKS